MLAYPFTYLGVSGFSRLHGYCLSKKMERFNCFSIAKAVMVLLSLSLGIAYLATPAIMTFVDASVPAVTGTSAYFSVAPTIPYQDVNNVVKTMDWLDANMEANSCVILHHVFLDWGRLYLDESQAIVYFIRNPDVGVLTATGRGFSQVFFVWWNRDIGWYDGSVPEGFVSVQDFGRISIFSL